MLVMNHAIKTVYICIDLVTQHKRSHLRYKAIFYIFNNNNDVILIWDKYEWLNEWMREACDNTELLYKDTFYYN